MFHPPVPRAIHEGSEVPSAAGPRGRWRARDRSSSDEDPVAWPQESLHSPHHSPPFMARMDNSPLQIQAACPPREQLAPSLHWEHVPDVTSLLPAPTQTETVRNPGCWQTSLRLCTTPLSPRARPAPLRHPDGLPPADAVALHPTPARGHCPVAPVRWDIALPVVSRPLSKRWPKGHHRVGTQPGTSLRLGEHLRGDIPKEELTKAHVGAAARNGDARLALGPCTCPPLSPLLPALVHSILLVHLVCAAGRAGVAVGVHPGLSFSDP